MLGTEDLELNSRRHTIFSQILTMAYVVFELLFELNIRGLERVGKCQMLLAEPAGGLFQVPTTGLPPGNTDGKGQVMARQSPGSCLAQPSAEALDPTQTLLFKP